MGGEESLRRLVALTHHAVAAAKVDVVHLLVQEAADPEVRGECGYTAKEWATWYSMWNSYSRMLDLFDNRERNTVVGR